MLWCRLALALVLACYAAFAQQDQQPTDTYLPDLQFNLTLPPTIGVVYIRNNWTVTNPHNITWLESSKWSSEWYWHLDQAPPLSEEDARNGNFAVLAVCDAWRGISPTAFLAGYQGSAMYLNGYIDTGKQVSMTVWEGDNSRDNISVSWSNNEANLATAIYPPYEERYQHSSVIVHAEYGSDLSTSVKLLPKLFLNSVTFTMTMKTQAYVHDQRQHVFQVNVRQANFRAGEPHNRVLRHEQHSLSLGHRARRLGAGTRSYVLSQGGGSSHIVQTVAFAPTVSHGSPSPFWTTQASL